MRKTKAAARRRKTESKGHGRRIVKGLGLLVLAAATLYGGTELWGRVRQLPLFHCTGITVTGNSLIPSSELLAGIRLPDSTGIFDIDVAAVADSVLRHPFVAHCSVGRRVPSRLKATVRERVPVAYVMLKTACLIDTGGVILPLPAAGAALDLPVISGIKPSAPSYGAVLDVPGITGALAFITGAAGARAGILERVSEIDVSSGNMLKIRTVAPALTVLLNAVPSADALRNWNVMEQHAGEGLPEISYIDLRFKNQIIIKRRS